MPMTSSAHRRIQLVRFLARPRAFIVAVALLAGSAAIMPPASADVLRPNVDMGAPGGGGGGAAMVDILIGDNGASTADHRAGLPFGPTMI